MLPPPLGKGGHGVRWVNPLAAHPPGIHLQTVKNEEETGSISGPPWATHVLTLRASSANLQVPLHHGRWQPKKQLEPNTRGTPVKPRMRPIRNLVGFDKEKGQVLPGGADYHHAVISGAVATQRRAGGLPGTASCLWGSLCWWRGGKQLPTSIFPIGRRTPPLDAAMDLESA